jgi:hypothetical protein
MTLDTLIATLEALRETHGGAIDVAVLDREYGCHDALTKVILCQHTSVVSGPPPALPGGWEDDPSLGDAFLSLE